MEYIRALSVHFAALVLLFSGVMGLISASFGDISFESERSFLSIVSETRSRRLNALLGALCVLTGGGALLLAVREFRPPSYPLLLLGSLGGLSLVALMFKLMFRSVEAMESTLAKGTLLLANGLILFMLLMAAFYLGAYLWRASIVA
jgi:hypothetical protein